MGHKAVYFPCFWQYSLMMGFQIKNSELILYADDEVLINTHPYTEILFKILQIDGDSIHLGCCKNFQNQWFITTWHNAVGVVHVKQARALVHKLCTHCPSPKVTSPRVLMLILCVLPYPMKSERSCKWLLIMNGKILERVKSFKYLGTTLDARMLLNQNAERVCKQFSVRLKQFARIRNLMSFSSASIFYKTIVMPVAEYRLLLILDSSCKTKTDKLEELHNRGIGIVCRGRRFAGLSDSNRLAIDGTKPLRLRCFYRNMKFTLQLSDDKNAVYVSVPHKIFYQRQIQCS